MADTFQAVTWSLAKTCGLRDEGTVAVPWKALNSVGDAQLYDQYLQETAGGDCRIYHDVLVAGISYYNSREKPCGGIDLRAAFARVGGIDGLKTMCGGCPANEALRLAQCSGYILLEPESTELETALCRILPRKDLKELLAAAFPVTRPLWYGFWMASPLSGEQVRILRMVMEGLLSMQGFVTTERVAEQLTAFCGALRRAEANSLALHVQLSVPGHTDFGISTTFAHCPSCKAATDPNKEWEGWDEGVMVTCKTCGRKYEPAATEASEKMTYDGDRLEKQLGEERFRIVWKDFLMVRGKSEQEADKEIAEEEATHKAAAAAHAEEERREKMKEQFVKEIVFSGLSPQVTGEYPSDYLFTAEEFKEVLRRCRRLEIRIVLVFRYASRRKNKRSQRWREHHMPFEVVEKWEAEGLKDGFGAIYAVDDEVAASWGGGDSAFSRHAKA